MSKASQLTRKIILWLLALVVAGCCCSDRPERPRSVTQPPPTNVVRSTPGNEPRESLAQSISQFRSAVVALNISMTSASGQKELYVASGFLVDRNLVVTNQHALDGNLVSINVLWDNTLAKQQQQARPVVLDKEHDLALLQLTQPAEHFLDIDATPLQPGDPVLLMGFPDTIETDTENKKNLYAFQGMVASAQPEKMVLDARVLRGSSGGPVIHLRSGKVVGIVAEVILDSEQEDLRLPSGTVQKQSVEGESVGVAIPARYISGLLNKYRQIHP